VVHLYACGQYVTSWYAPPFQTAWNTRQSPNGACTLTITAYDLAWNSFTASTSVTLDNDFTGPAVAITAPAAGAALSSAVDVQASATDPSGVARVELLASPGGGYTTLGSDASEPYAVTLDPRRLMLGAWTLQARATDSWGNVSLSAPVSVTVVDVTPPTVVLTAPAPGAVLGGDVALTATASDDRGISRVSWYASGRLVGSSYSPPYAYAWRTRDDPNGPSRLVARAVDGSGNVAEAEIQVSVLNDRAAPQVTLASPLAGATLTGSAVLTATATDDVGVTRVEFLDGSTVVGTDTTPPYETIWNVSGVAAGDHTLRARAYDAAGNMSSSAAVPVTVAPPFVPAATALYDAARRAPACNVATASCSSGSLLVGRSVLGPEPNPPNTIAGSCTDGTAGRFHYDESNDALKVSTADGTALASGKTVTIEATVWVWSYPSDWLDLYHSPSAGAPVWTLVRTIRPTANGLQRLSTTFVLPAGSTQVVRAVFRYGGSAGSCVPGSYNDHDDLVFTVR